MQRARKYEPNTFLQLAVPKNRLDTLASIGDPLNPVISPLNAQ